MRRRERWAVHAKRVHRLDTEERLQLARQRPRRRTSIVARPHRVVMTAQNMDCGHDVVASGENVWVLSVIDLHTRECVAPAAQHRFGGEYVGHV